MLKAALSGVLMKLFIDTGNILTVVTKVNFAQATVTGDSEMHPNAFR